MTAEFKDRGAHKPCNLIAGEYPRVERVVAIASGGALAKGAVLGRVAASGKFVLSATGASDGSQVPDAILAEDVDAGTDERQAVVYVSGEFNEKALTLGKGHTARSIRDGLRAKSIFLRDNQP